MDGKRSRCPLAIDLPLLINIDNEIPKVEWVFSQERFLAGERAQQDLKQVVQQHMTDCCTSSQFSKARQLDEGEQVAGKRYHGYIVIAVDVWIGQIEQWETQTVLIGVHKKSPGLFPGVDTKCTKVAKRCPCFYKPSNVAKELEVEAIEKCLERGLLRTNASSRNGWWWC